MFTPPSPKPVIMNTRPPMSDSAEPPGSAETLDQWILSATRTMNITVSTPVMIVITVCMRMIRSKPITPPKMVSATTTIIAMIFVAVPPPQPRCPKTVAIASVARIISTVSQPTVRSHEMTVGSLLPRTPNGARLSTLVGADPRLPAIATNPQSTNEMMIPATLTQSACQNEIPNPSTNDP